MNKLEELIIEGRDDAVNANFEAGAHLVLSLDLPVKFAEWLTENYIFDRFYYPKNDFKDVFQAIQSYGNATAKELYVYWINNIYDGK